MTDEEREKLALQKLMSAMGGGKSVKEPKFKALVRKSILQKQLGEGNFVGGEKVQNEMKNGMPAPDDPDLVPPGVVLDLWIAVADGVQDKNGECTFCAVTCWRTLACLRTVLCCCCRRFLIIQYLIFTICNSIHSLQPTTKQFTMH